MLTIDELSELYHRSIEDDNTIHMNRFLENPPHPSYLSGFLDGDGCIYIREQLKHTYTTGFTISQCRTNILHIFKYHYGGSISTDYRNRKEEDEKKEDSEEKLLYPIKQCRNLFCYLNSQPSYRFLLNDIKDHIICKSIQAYALYEFQKYVHHLFVEEKELLYQRVKDANARIIKPEYDFSKLNIQYIAGLFDAEGYIYMGKQKENNHYTRGLYVKLTQKNHPEILYAICDFMKYGSVSNDIYYYVDTFDMIYDFLSQILPYTIVKHNQILTVLTYIESSNRMINKVYNDEVHQIRELCYKIMNKEKHESEEDQNIHDFGSGKFIKREECERIEKEEAHKEHIKEVYQQKSENMKGEKNHNYGKEKSAETKHKMAISHKIRKKSISDEIILQVREDFANGMRNIDIQEKYQLSRDQVSKIKNGTLCTEEELNSIEYYEKVKHRKPMSKEEQAIEKRRVNVDQIFFILEEFLKKKSKTSKKDGPLSIFEKLIQIQTVEEKKKDISFDSVLNVIRGKTIIYECEVDAEKYAYYQELVQKVKDAKA